LPHVTAGRGLAHHEVEDGPQDIGRFRDADEQGLEVIEATLLFDCRTERDVIVHPQSVVHSLVEYADGSMLAQLGAPGMRTPIAQALAWPERFASGVQSLDFDRDRTGSARAPDHARFPSLGLRGRRRAPAAPRGGC